MSASIATLLCAGPAFSQPAAGRGPQGLLVVSLGELGHRDQHPDVQGTLARISHGVSQRGGADGHGYKAREGKIPQAYLTVLEESDRAQRSGHARIRRSSRKPVRKAG